MSLTSSSGLASSVHGPLTAEACDPGATCDGSLQWLRKRRRARSVKSERSPGLPGGVEPSHFSEFAWCLLEMALATMALSREGRVERSLERQAPSVCLPEVRLAWSMWRGHSRPSS